jgi:predicted Zn-dependent peptidase
MMRLAATVAIAAAAATAWAQTPPPKTPAAPRKPAVAAALPNYNELKFPELRPIASPNVQSFTLPNGLRLLLLEDHELPLINGTVLVRTGSAFDPPERIGLAAFAVQVMLEGGTTTRPGEELVRRFQDLGAELAGQVSENSLAISFSGLKENGDEVLGALKDGLSAPEFPQVRIDLMKMRLHNTIAHRNDDGAAILRREFVSTIFGKRSPYGAQMEYANVDRINRGDLVSFHQRYFFPANVMLALEGDFDAGRMKEHIEALFADWTSEQPPVPAFPDVGNAVAPGKFLAVKKDAPRAFFAVGQVGSEELDKDNPALEIMAGILAGGPHGRLNQLLRGAVDGLAATWTPGLGHPGLFEVSGTIGNPFITPKVLRTVYDELNRIRVEQVSEQELKTAKSTALNSLVFAFDNQLSMMPRLAQYQYFNVPGDYTQQHQKALAAVTREDVLRVARERLDPAKMSTVVVANPTAFEAPLESLGGSAVSTIDLTIPPPKPEATLGDTTSQQRARQMLARAQQAVGGADKVAAVTDYVQEIAYQFDVSAGGAQANMTERWIAPSYLRQDTTMGTSKISVYCDGKIGWFVSGQNSGALTGVQLKQVQSDLFRTIFPLLLSDRMPTRKLTALDDETVEISDADGNIVKLVFDNATGLPKNELYDAPTANGPALVIETYSDYRDVSGLKVPFKVAIDLAGNHFQDLNIKSTQINAGLKLADLEKRR